MIEKLEMVAVVLYVVIVGYLAWLVLTFAGCGAAFVCGV